MVTIACLGTMTWGEQNTEAEAIEQLDWAVNHGGINFIDTAELYPVPPGPETCGRTEYMIGRWLAKGGPALRKKIILASKVAGFSGRGYIVAERKKTLGIEVPADQSFVTHLSREQILEACDASLKRLQTDYLDLLWCHFWDRHTPIEELMRGMEQLVRQGKVRHIGLSDHPAWVCALAQSFARQHGGTPLVALQIEYSLLQRTVEAELIPMAMHEGMGVTPWSPLRGGVLSGKFSRANRPKDDGSTRVRSDSKYLNEHTYLLLDELHALAGAKRCSVAQVALRWTMDRPGVSSTIIGARTMAQLEDNMGAMAVNLTVEESSKLDALSKPELPFPCEFLEFVRTGIQNGTTINGQRSDAWPLSPKDASERW
jgi:aryl-alcohol dehydrogenase-like predicted oxidoreductase